MSAVINAGIASEPSRSREDDLVVLGHVSIGPTHYFGGFGNSVNIHIDRCMTSSPSLRQRGSPQRAKGPDLLCPGLNAETNGPAISTTTPVPHSATIESKPAPSTPPSPVYLSSSANDSIPDLTEEVQRVSLNPVYIGPYSIIYRGQRGDQRVAIKAIRPLSTDTLRAIRRRMRREVGAASLFDHPNILKICGIMEPSWCDYGCIITPWYQNGNASTYIWHERVGIYGRHQLANILINDLGTPVIGDFGLVCHIDTEGPSEGNDNTTTVHTGTVRYLAYELVQPYPPEQRSKASDIHALGCVAYEFIYLEQPYATRVHNAAGHIFRDIAAGIPPAFRPDSSLHPSIGALWDFLETCWDKEPAGRPIISAVRNSLETVVHASLKALAEQDV